MTQIVATPEQLLAAPPPARPSARFEPYATLIRLSLLLGLSVGTGLGLTLLLQVTGLLTLALPWAVLVQVHGHAQLLGFVALFVMAVGSVIFPRFLAAPLRRPRQVTLAGGLLAAGVVLRTVGQPLEPSLLRTLLLGMSAVLAPAGLLTFAQALRSSCRQSVQPPGRWQRALLLAILSLLLSLALNATAVWALVVQGLALVPPALDEAILHLQLRGFVFLAIAAVGMRVFPQFLLLRPPREAALSRAIAAYAAGLGLTVVGWLLVEQPAGAPLRALGAGAEAAALIVFIWGLRLYEPPSRPSGVPGVTNPTRLWLRLAFGWLLLGTGLDLWLALRAALGLGGPSLTEVSAARHAFATGFLLLVLISMATRILPVYSGWAYTRPRFNNTLIGLLLAGALLRVGGELLGGYAPPAGPLAGLGGVLTTLAVLLFGMAVWPTLGQAGRQLAGSFRELAGARPRGTGTSVPTTSALKPGQCCEQCAAE